MKRHALELARATENSLTLVTEASKARVTVIAELKVVSFGFVSESSLLSS
jgi:hypothetical protein